MPSRFEAVQTLSDDGEARAVLVRDRYRGGRLVVMKRLPRRGRSHADTAALRRQLLLLRRVRHPNIAPVLDVAFDEPEETYNVTTEHVDGLDFVAFARQLPPDRLEDLVAEVLRGLAHVHAWGLFHQGLKPSNILVERDGDEVRPRIVDFGPPRSNSSPHADPHAEAERLRWLAPELIAGGKGDARSDLYGVGLMLWETLAGRPAVDSDDPEVIAAWHAGDRATPVPTGRLSRLIARLTDPMPGRRCKSAADALRLLSKETGRLFFHQGSAAEECLLTGRFVGRDAEVHRLEEVAGRAFRGEGGGLFVVEGGRGLGKSRLLEELEVLAQLNGLRVVSATARRARSRPLGVVRDVLRDLVGALGPDHACVADAVPILGSVLPNVCDEPDQDAALPPEHDRLRFQQAVAELFAAAGEVRPLLILIDDLHWIDDASFEALQHFVRQMNGVPVMLIASLDVGSLGDEQEHPVARWFDECEREVLTLAPLEASAAEDLVGSAFALPGNVKEISELVTRLTGGVPLYMEELLRNLVEGHSFAFDDDGRLLSDPGSEAADERAVRLVLARIDRLPPASHRLVEALAIFDGAASRSAVAVAASMTMAEVDAEVRGLEAADILRTDLTPDEPFWCFRNGLFREVVADRIDPADRSSMHDRVVTHLEETPGVPAAELAYHAQRGTAADRVLAHAARAAAEAGAVHDDAQERLLLEAALDAAESLGRDAEQRELMVALADVQERLGDVDEALLSWRRLSNDDPDDPHIRVREGDLLRRRGAWADAERVLTEGRRLAAALGNVPLTSRAERGLADCLFRRGRSAEALAGLDAAYARLGSDGLPGERARILSSMGVIRWFRGEREDALQHHLESRRAFEEAGDRLGCATADVNVGLALWTRGRLTDALDRFRRAETMARRMSHYFVLASALHNRGVIELELGRLDDASRTLGASLHMRRRLADEVGLAKALNNIGLVHHFAGRLESARRLIEESLARRAGAGETRGQANGHVNLGLVRLDLGDDLLAEESFAEALRLARDEEDRGVIGAALLGLARLHLRRCEIEPAHEAAERARDVFAGLDQPHDVADADLLIGRIDVALGRVTPARLRIADALRAIRRTGNARLLVQGRRAAGDARSGAAGLSSYAAARRTAERHGFEEMAWRAAHEEGLAFEAAERHEEAVRALRRAMEGLRRLHDRLPEHRRESWLKDARKLDLQASFAGLVRKTECLT